MSTSNKHIRQLRKILNDHFSMGDLHLIAYDLGIDSDNLNGNTKIEKIHDLLVTLQRQERLPELVVLIREERPQLTLPELPKKQTKAAGKKEELIKLPKSDLPKPQTNANMPPTSANPPPTLQPTFSLFDTAVSHFYFQRGKSRRASKKYEKALKDLNYAISLQPTLIPAYFERGKTLLSLEKHKEAIADFNLLIRYAPNEVQYFQARGVTYSKLGKTEEAFADFYTALSIDPNNGITLNLICWHGTLLGRADEVKNHCEKAVTLATNEHTRFSRRDSRGVNSALRGDIASAIVDFEAYVDYSIKHSHLKKYFLKRTIWLEMLRKGENPFNEETLKQLNNE